MADGSPASGYHLGLDLGTTSVKVALLDAVTKKCVQAYREETAAVINETKPEFAEQNVQAIVAKLENAVKKIPAELLAKVRYVGICGQMHGCVLWNSESISNWLSTPYAQLGETSRLITWEDGRCSSDFLSSLPRLKNYHAVSSGFGCATIFWLARHRPECLQGYDCAGTVMDLVVCLLCGLQKPVMSTHNAVSWGYFDVERADWAFDELETGSFPVHFLPEVKEPGATAGKAQQKTWGIPAGVAVGVALGDLQCSVLEAQSCHTDAVLNISTSCQLAVVVKDVSGDIPSSVQLLPFFFGQKVVTAASMTGGNALDAFVSTLESWLVDLGITCLPSKDEIYNKVLRHATERTGTTLKLCPTLWGERHAPDQRGQVNCASPDNCSLGDVTASLCRGILENLLDMFPRPFLTSCQVKRIVGTGTALQRNEVLRKLVGQVFGLPLVMRTSGDAACGAALAMDLNFVTEGNAMTVESTFTPLDTNH